MKKVRLNLNVPTFFGAKDTNGRELYTGDIVEYEGRVCEIKFEPDCGAFVVEWAWSKNQHYAVLTCDVACECTWMGDIHANPEMRPR